jgi:hypothetical protein
MVTDPGTDNVPTAQDGDTWRETQWMRHVWWIILVVGLVAATSWLSFVQQIVLGRPFGSNPGPDGSVWLLWLGFGIAFPLFFWAMRLTVEVSPEALRIRYIPLLRRSIPLDAIRRVEARRYNPLLEYGGWGIRGWRRGRMIYSVSGTQCVELELHDGTFLAVGSTRAEELAAAIERFRTAG